MKLTEREKAYHDGYKHGRFDEYAERMGYGQAEKVKAKLDKQKNCPYCHGDVALKDVYIDPQNDYTLWIDGNKLQEIILCDACLVVGTNRIDGSTNAWDQPITINYCPMCGRPLNEEE